jgi:hypothetical protein
VVEYSHRQPSPLAASFGAFGRPGHHEVVINTTAAGQPWHGSTLAPWRVEFQP